MHRRKWFRELVLAATLLTPTLVQAEALDNDGTDISQDDEHKPHTGDVCSRLPKIANGGSSQLEIDEYFDKPEAQWTDQDLSQLSSDYSACYDSTTIDFGQKSLTHAEFPSIVQSIIGSANKYRQAAKVFEIEKSSYSSECQFVIDEFMSDGSTSLEHHIPFQKISDLFRADSHDEACDLSRSYSAKLEAKRKLYLQCYEHAKALSTPTFKPEWFFISAGADEKTKSIIDANMSFYGCKK